MNNTEIELSDTDIIVTKTKVDGVITFANEDLMRITGYSEKELIGSKHNIFRHKDMPDEVFKDLWNTIMNERTWRGIVKNKTKDGRYYWVRADVSPMYVAGDLVGFISVRIKPDEKEKTSAEKNYKKMKSGEFNGEILYGEIMEEKKIDIMKKIEDIKIKNKIRFINAIAIIGFTLIAYININLIEEMKIEHKLIIEKMINLTDGIRNEKGLYGYNKIDKNIKEVIFKDKIDNNVKIFNIKQEEIIIIGIIIFILFILLNCLISSIINPLNVIKNSLKSISNGDYNINIKYNSKNEIGEIVDALISTSVRLGFDVAYKNKKDIEIIKYEEKLKSHEEKEILINHINQLQRIDSIGRMTAGISHNFNNILSAIIGYNELNVYVAENCENYEVKNEILENTNHISIASEKAADLIKTMMTYAHQNNEKKIKNVKKTSIVINDVMVLIKPALNSKVTIEVEIEEELIIEIDEVELHQILINLIINSRDAMKKNGKIKINMKSVMINTECTACLKKMKGKFIQLSVADNGTGISEAVIDKIFEPFFTTKEVGDGTGIGLASVCGLVHEVNGHIIVKSDTSKETCGTTFKLLFPIQSA